MWDRQRSGAKARCRTPSCAARYSLRIPWPDATGRARWPASASAVTSRMPRGRPASTHIRCRTAAIATAATREAIGSPRERLTTSTKATATAPTRLTAACPKRRSRNRTSRWSSPPAAMITTAETARKSGTPQYGAWCSWYVPTRRAGFRHRCRHGRGGGPVLSAGRARPGRRRTRPRAAAAR
ncbi:hypothetical protein SMALB_2137 [Streptomyces malaysiensis]|uniref:Uncharacterized protein n=1 Tax=Streptomyces malaysiensis TaxID=92644 RepID=A0A7X5X2C3_STRMQ|nr:hypothetical protein [Streptomyces malaysiensis]